MDGTPGKVGIMGCAGRMGQLLVQEVAASPALELYAASEVSGKPEIGQDVGPIAGMGPLGIEVTDDLETMIRKCDVVIDFTRPEATDAVVELGKTHSTALVIGTTGLSAEQKDKLHHAAKCIPMVFAPNMSVGVNVLVRLVSEAAKLLGPAYDLEVVEAHHRYKKDAPSGTALRLVEALEDVCESRGTPALRKHGREGISPRSEQEIGIHALRGGGIAGDHAVYYCGEYERLELTHRATDRRVFAQGAIRAATWVTRQRPGLYGMDHVLGLDR